MNQIEKIPDWIQGIYVIVAELEAAFPGRSFTPDGHLVGSIGEVLAAHDYNLVLLPSSTTAHDAKDDKNRSVQIKATQKNTVALRAQPDYLIVLRIDKRGFHEEIYNGPGCIPWNIAGPKQSNGQRSINISKLRRENIKVSEEDRIKRRPHQYRQVECKLTTG